MHLTLHPSRRLPGQLETQLCVEGDVLTIDGEEFDFGPLPEGGVLPAEATGSAAFLGEVARVGGVVHAQIVVTLGDTVASDQPTDPAHWIVPDADGTVAIPALRKEEDA